MGLNFRVAEARPRGYGSRAFLELKVVHFEYSQILWLTAMVVPLLGLFLGWAWRRRRERVTRFIHANLVEQLTLGLSAARRKAKLALLLGVVLLLFIALARPKGGYELQKTETRSLDILVAVDTSRSMLATDQSPNRLERAKLAVLDLMRLAKRDRLGLIAFSGTAFLQCPLTIDRNAFVQNVNSLSTDIIPQGGTAISEAVTEALRTFGKEEDNHKVLVVMTDGEDHEAGVADVAQKANDIGMKIFTIGLGSTAGGTDPVAQLADRSPRVPQGRERQRRQVALKRDPPAYALHRHGGVLPAAAGGRHDGATLRGGLGRLDAKPNREPDDQALHRALRMASWPGYPAAARRDAAWGGSAKTTNKPRLNRDRRRRAWPTVAGPCRVGHTGGRTAGNGSERVRAVRCASTRSCWRKTRKTPDFITTPEPQRMAPRISRKRGAISTRP